MAVLAPAILLLSIATVIIILVSVFTKSLGGYGANILWSYHPFFMTIGFVLLMTMGLISYVSDFGAKFQANFSDRARRRLLHGTLQIFAAMFVLIGYLVAFTVHEGSGRSHIAAQSPLSHKVHVWVGLVAVAGVILQVVVGLYKYVVRVRDDIKWATWHGKAGPFVWAFGFLAIAVAFYMVFWEGTSGTSSSGAGHAVAITVWIMLALLLGLSLFMLLWGSGRSSSRAALQHAAYASGIVDWDSRAMALGGAGVGADDTGALYGVMPGQGRSSITSLNSKLLYTHQ